MHESRFHPSARINAVQSPIIPIISDLIRATPGTISLGQGVVYYGPPKAAFDNLSALNNSIDSQQYGPVEGIAPLIEKITEKLERENNLTIGNTTSVIVTAGANMGFLNALFAITNPGDEIILPLPYYFNHEMAIRMLNCRPIVVATDDNYQLCIDKIKAAITDKTRAIVTVSPNNPSGVIYPESDIRTINKLCLDHGIYHISDEAYEYFIYEDAEHFSPGSIQGAQTHTISLFSLSKSYGFASWRIGYMVIPEYLSLAVKKVQDTNLICPPLASQYAAIGALEVGSDYCYQKLKAIITVRRQMIEKLNSIQSLCRLSQSNGAFYLFLKILTEIADMELATKLIREHRVAVIPGNTFGMQQACYLRVAYGALKQDTALEGINRLIKGLKNILST